MIDFVLGIVMTFKEGISVRLSLKSKLVKWDIGISYE